MVFRLHVFGCPSRVSKQPTPTHHCLILGDPCSVGWSWNVGHELYQIRLGFGSLHICLWLCPSSGSSPAHPRRPHCWAPVCDFKVNIGLVLLMLCCWPTGRLQVCERSAGQQCHSIRFFISSFLKTCLKCIPSCWSWESSIPLAFALLVPVQLLAQPAAGLVAHHLPEQLCSMQWLWQQSRPKNYSAIFCIFFYVYP